MEAGMSIPSIFNDVIGPVMRGPSSSHSAAAVRIGKIARELVGCKLRKVTVRFDINGSLPTTYLSQGSDMGLSGGLLGLEADDAKLPDYKAELSKAGVTLEYIHDDFGDPHPNTYNLTIENDHDHYSLVALSTGGGMIEVIKINDLDVSFFGDCYGLVLDVSAQKSDAATLLKEAGYTVSTDEKDDSGLIFATSFTPFGTDLESVLLKYTDKESIRTISPVLPVLTTLDSKVPFTDGKELHEYAGTIGLDDLADLALQYEAERGGISIEEVYEKAYRLIDILEASIEEGLAGTDYQDRILGCQADGYARSSKKGELVDTGVLDTVIPYVTALMEVKSAMGVIVAAPTAGSCGGLPGAVIAVADRLKLGRREKARALLAAGVVGALIATKSTFSAEICGCQAECGVSSGMIGAAVVSMMGGGYEASLTAASLALQNCFGMVCDPVAGRVEVPCLGKNILAATNGVSCANLALAGFDHVVPFDEVVIAMDGVGRSLPHELRCTALGGLSQTPASKKVAKKLSHAG